MLNADEPRSNTAPPTDDVSISSAEHLGQLARRAAAEAERPEHAVDALVRRQLRVELARSGRRAPILISTTQPCVTSRNRGSPSSGAAAIETQHDSSPASAGRVPSIGSTTSTLCAPSAADEPAVLGVEGDARRALGDEPLEQLLGRGVDRERHVAALAVAGMRALRVRAEQRQHALPQRERRARARARASAAPPAAAGARRARPRPSAARRRAARRAPPVSPGSSRLIRSARSAVRVSSLAVDGDDHVAVRGDVASGPGTRSGGRRRVRPASSAGLSSTTSETSAPVSTSSPSRSASCG